jgi:hypothetical protein
MLNYPVQTGLLFEEVVIMSLACFMGDHKWEQVSPTYDGSVLDSTLIPQNMKKLSTFAYIEQCKRCPIQRGVITDGSAVEYTSPKLITLCATHYENTRRPDYDSPDGTVKIRRGGLSISIDMTKKQKFIEEYVAKQLAERDNKVAENAIKKYMEDTDKIVDEIRELIDEALGDQTGNFYFRGTIEDIDYLLKTRFNK